MGIGQCGVRAADEGLEARGHVNSRSGSTSYRSPPGVPVLSFNDRIPLPNEGVLLDPMHQQPQVAQDMDRPGGDNMIEPTVNKKDITDRTIFEP